MSSSTGSLFSEEGDGGGMGRGREERGTGALGELPVGDAPLADRLRPRSIEEVVGQEHLLGEGKLLHGVFRGAEPPSAILWGPPGVGKTTLARLMARSSGATFVELSATASGVKDVRAAADEARRRRRSGLRTLLFIDEIHRFNKAQQDTLLPYVERGDVILVGATTENPSFEVVSPLLSRCKVLTLEPLSQVEIVELLQRALSTDAPRGLGAGRFEVETEDLEALAAFADGDARVALNTLELAAEMALERLREAEERPETESEAGPVRIDADVLREAAGSRRLRYDKAGEEHFNLISALHKSVRNSDPDAALYWLARMLEGGEDPLYIGRRLVRMASEDIGLADPTALPLAMAGFDAVHAIGLPEGALALAEVTVYLATAPKSNALYRGYQAARADAVERGNLAVPLSLRNAPTRLMADMGYGQGYEYAHDTEEGVADMRCLPEELGEPLYYRPGSRGHEQEIRRRLEEWREARRRARRRGEGDDDGPD